MLFFTGGMMPIVIMSKTDYRRSQGEIATAQCREEAAHLNEEDLQRTIRFLRETLEDKDTEILCLRNQHELDMRELSRINAMLDRKDKLIHAADKRIEYIEAQLKDANEKAEKLKAICLNMGVTEGKKE